MRRRLARRLAAIVSIAALVLGQTLVAAHGCVLPAPADEAVEACRHEAPEPASGALCKAHCEAGQQTVDQAKPLPAAPDLATPLLVVAADDLAARAFRSVASGTGWLAHAGAPPPLLLTGRLRI